MFVIDDDCAARIDGQHGIAAHDDGDAVGVASGGGFDLIEAAAFGVIIEEKELFARADKPDNRHDHAPASVIHRVVRFPQKVIEGTAELRRNLQQRIRARIARFTVEDIADGVDGEPRLARDGGGLLVCVGQARANPADDNIGIHF